MDIMQAVKKIREEQAEVCRRKAWSVGVWAGLIITLLPDGFVLMDSRSGKLIYRRLI